MNKKIAFVFPLHPLHKKLAEAIGCDFFPTLKNLPKNYDIYLVEGSVIKTTLLKKLRKIEKDSKIITLFSDPRLFHLYINKKFNFRKEKMVKYPKWKSFLVKKFIKKLDGAICIGDFSTSLFRKFNKECPIVTIPAFVFREKSKVLSVIKPNLSNHNILFIGHGPDFYYKGLDLLIKTFKIIKNKIPDSKLYILGDWKVKKEWRSEGVHFEGTQEIIPYLKKSSISLHLGRGEGFGINILESMLAGVPTIVSRYTGAKEAVEKVDEKFVVPLEKVLISKRVIEYFSINLKKKKRLSKKCKRVAREFREEKILKEFRRRFTSFIQKIYKNNDTIN